MSARKTRLVDCNPRWITSGAWTGAPEGIACGVSFDCPEGHEGCSHAIPFTPAIDGSTVKTWQSNGAQWQRIGDRFETLTLSPSIRRTPSYPSRGAAIAAGCIPEYVTPALLCALHIFVRDGAIEFCGDSR